MVDEWGDHLWPADMTYRWTYRGGPTRQDIFRTFSTGVNGTPMPSYYDVIEESDRWDLVNYIYSLNPSDTPDYSELLMVPFVEDEIDLANADELFATAPMARFPVVGQIVETGRNFYPAITAVEIEAVYNQKEIAFRVRWHDRIADRTGHNDPTLPVPPWDEDNDFGGDAGDDEGGFWGDAAEEEGGEEDIWGDAVEEEGGDDFWGEEEDDSGSGFSDAVALQFPSSAPTGIRKPYFIFGDVQNSVDLWFVDVARGMVDQYIGRGSQALELSEADEIDVQVDYQEGRWTALFKRSLKGQGGITFAEDSFAPIAFSVWDGFNRERGNKRSLSAWFYLYLEPQQKISPVGPMIRAGLIALFVELLLVFIIRKKYMPGRQKSEVPVGAVPERG